MSCRFYGASDPGGKLLGEADLCDRNLNILAHAQMIELDIGSQCGGHGVCGGDRVRIQNKELSPVTEKERRHLTAEDLASGWRLACQCYPERSGITLDIEVKAE